MEFFLYLSCLCEAFIGLNVYMQVCVCVRTRARLFVHEFVYMYVCLMPRCVSQGLVFPLHCTLTAVSNKASYDLCMSLGICARASGLIVF